MNELKCKPSLPATRRNCFDRFPRWRCGALACLVFSCLAFAQEKSSVSPTSPPAAEEPLAVIGGEPIYPGQLPPEEQAQLQRMMQQVYSVKLRALREVLDRKLIEAEAKKKGVSVEDLLKAEVNSKVADPSDEEVSAYYQAHRQNLNNQPLDQVKEKIRQGLKDIEIQKASMVYTQGLLQRAVDEGDLIVKLRPPQVEMTVDPARLRGDAKAPVTIVEFSDFSCGYCRKAESTMTDLLARYPGKIKLGYRDFPLRQLHPQAELAAEASRCAGEQGKYWEYHDVLFAGVGKQGRDDLLADARTLKLDEKPFEACLDSGRYKPQVDQDIQLGARGGVLSTPGFFINGTFIDGAQPEATFEQVIDRALAAQQRASN